MIEKFSCAFRGILAGLKHRSILIQFVLGTLAAAAGAVMKLSAVEWVVVILCIGSVIAAEMLNTCIEKICDMYSKEYREDIRDIKDIAAGAVLIISIASFLIAIVILAVHLKEIL